MQSAKQLLMTDALVEVMKQRAKETGQEVFIIGADLINSEDNYRLSKWLVRQKHFSPSAKLTFAAISDHAYGDKTKAWPSQKRVAELTALSERTVRRAIDELKGQNAEKQVLLAVVRRGLNKTNLYGILYKGGSHTYTVEDLPDWSKRPNKNDQSTYPLDGVPE